MAIIYEYVCDDCKIIKEIDCNLAKHEKLKKNPPKCDKCKKKMRQILNSFGTPGWVTSKGIQGARSVEQVQTKDDK